MVRRYISVVSIRSFTTVPLTSRAILVGGTDKPVPVPAWTPSCSGCHLRCHYLRELYWSVAPTSPSTYLPGYRQAPVGDSAGWARASSDHSHGARRTDADRAPCVAGRAG